MSATPDGEDLVAIPIEPAGAGAGTPGPLDLPGSDAGASLLDRPARDADPGAHVRPSASSPEPPQPLGVTPATLEALLFVAERPLSPREIARLAGVEVADVEACLSQLDGALADRGIRLVRMADRVELATAPEAGPLVARYVGADGLRLSPAALETLAIVAYRQPVTRAAVEHIRGVDSDYVLRGLLHRRLVAEQGRAATPGRPILYGTGFDFLERFGLTSLDDLPPLGPEIAARLAEAGDDAAPAAGSEWLPTGPAAPEVGTGRVRASVEDDA